MEKVGVKRFGDELMRGVKGNVNTLSNTLKAEKLWIMRK